MTFPSHDPRLFRWKTHVNSKVTSAGKMHVKNGDINQWRKRVEKASEFAVSEVFPHKKPHSGTSNIAVALQSSDQLRDHDDAYSEAQALLSDWLSSKLRLELEMEEEDDLICTAERKSPPALAGSQPACLTYDNFDDLYNCLTEEEEHSAVNSFLQDLMEQEVLDSGMMEELALDVGQARKKFRNPTLTMEARHQQVRENRARREAERQRQQRERVSQLGAREEAKRREHEEEARKKQEARRQEELVQQEMVRLRRQMEERKTLEQLVRKRERERGEAQRAARNLQSAPTLTTKQKQQHVTDKLHKDQKLQTKVHMSNLKCLQRHFSGWYSVVLDRRIRLGKVMALCDWKMKLRAWRVWRAVVWAAQKQREVARAEEELRAERRQCQVAVESDRKRLLRRYLNEWQLWCRMEREQRELLAQQQETRRKMAALINAALTGNLQATETPVSQPIMAPPEAPKLTEAAGKEGHRESGNLNPDTSTLHQIKTAVGAVTQPTQPWQVTQRHVAPTAAELHKAWQTGEGGGFKCSKHSASPGQRFENRHAVQQQIIAQQRKLLKEQQEQIARLKEEQSMMGLELEMEKTAQLSQLSIRKGSRPKSHNINPTEQSCRAERVAGEPDSLCTPPRKAVTQQTCPHPIITAMEARARQRAERRKEIEELKRKKEEEKLAEMKAAEEQRRREEEEEKRKAAEKKREEKRQEREREEEKQRQQKKQQDFLKLARQHYHRSLLLRRGLAPWKRLIQLRQVNIQLAESHHNLILLRRCTQGWQQSARESASEKKASADQLHQHFLLRRSLSCWKRLKDWRMIQEERAERFYRSHTLRRFLMALVDHVTEEKLVGWDHLELAQEHNKRRMLQRCFLTWRQLPCLLRKEREREERREKLGRKVTEVLPDFCSNPL
ncbi:coiled-coil domain-containing protein 191 [Anabas testudineus]|uniref:Coiled-coil domain containing 191 n=1 Tax=Anabas testudineus TaxID=64144 RepID=A0A3Q1I2X5_ANATE|nr:coiled-coil domain-containing protein 191 [Anabas testudineus]